MMKLAEDIIKGNSRAVARGISLAENNSKKAQELLKEIFSHTGESLIVGITGSPGSGKSTLVDKIVDVIRAKEKKIGIIAVDPSSPFSGGAILGDRIRMMRHSIDSDVFIRSMATRGHLGGLAKASGEAISILEASGKDVILIETVGVGQDEVEIVKFADIILVVLVPGAGDEIQVFKAGIMEIADIFVLNKSDSPEADKTERQLKAMLDMGSRDKPPPPLVKTTATKAEGIDSLWQEVEDIISKRDQKVMVSRKKRLISWMLRDIINERLTREIYGCVQDSEYESFIEKIYSREIDPYSVADRIIQKLKGE
jgi:LAO/AO transport system kinase